MPRPSINDPTIPLNEVSPWEPLEPPAELVSRKDDVLRMDRTKIGRDREKKIAEALVDYALYRMGALPERFEACRQQCIDKAVSTHVVKAMTWSSWGGYKDLTVKMKKVAKLTRKTGFYHCPSAPALVMVVILKKVLGVVGTGNDQLSSLMSRYETQDLAPTAIHAFQEYRNGMVCINKPYESDGLEIPEDEDIELLDDEDVSPRVDIYRTGYPNYAPLLFKLRDIRDQGLTLRERPTYKLTTQHTITRQDARQALQEVLVALRRGDFPPDRLAQLVTLERVKVLSEVDKGFINLWAVNTKNSRLMAYHDQTRENRDEFSWTEEVEERLPETWSGHPAYTVWQEVEEWARQNTTNPLIKSLVLLREIFEDQNSKGVDIQFHERLEEIRREVMTTVRDHNDEVRVELMDLKGRVNKLEKAVIEFGKDITAKFDYLCGMLTDDKGRDVDTLTEEGDAFHGYDTAREDTPMMEPNRPALEPDQTDIDQGHGGDTPMTEPA